MAKNGPKLDIETIVKNLLDRAKKIEPDSPEYKSSHSELSPPHALITDPNCVQYVLGQLILTLGKQPEKEIRESTLPLLEFSAARVNQNFYFLHYFAHNLNVRNVQHQILIRHLVNDLTNSLYIYCIYFLANENPLECHPEYYKRNIYYKLLLEKVNILHSFFSTFFFENECVFPPSVVEKIRQKKEMAPLLILKSEISFLKVERHISYKDVSHESANRIHCNGQLSQILERKKSVSNISNIGIYEDIESLFLKCDLLPEIDEWISKIYLKKLEFQKRFPSCTVHYLSRQTSQVQKQTKSILIGFDSIISQIDDYSKLNEEQWAQLTQCPDFYKNILKSLDLILNIDQINQQYDFILILEKAQIVCTSWKTLFKKLNHPICIALEKEISWVKLYCEEAMTFINTQKQISLESLAQQFQGLFINKPITVDIIKSTKDIMAFAEGIRPNQSQEQVQIFLERYKEHLQYPTFVEEILITAHDMLVGKTELQLLEAHQPRIKATLERINIVHFILQHFARPFDVTHSVHHKLIFILISDLIFILKAYGRYYIEHDIPGDERNEVFAIFSLYKTVLDQHLGHYKFFATYLMTHPEHFQTDLVTLVKHWAVDFYLDVLKINLDLIEIAKIRDPSISIESNILIFEVQFALFTNIYSHLCQISKIDENSVRTVLAKLRERIVALTNNTVPIDDTINSLLVTTYSKVIDFKIAIVDLIASPDTVALNPETQNTHLHLIEESILFVKGMRNQQHPSIELINYIKSTFNLMLAIDDFSSEFISTTYLPKAATLCYTWIKFLGDTGNNSLIKAVSDIFDNCARFFMETLALEKKKKRDMSTRLVLNTQNIASAATPASLEENTLTPELPTESAKISKSPKDRKKKKKKGKKSAFSTSVTIDTQLTPDIASNAPTTISGPEPQTVEKPVIDSTLTTISEPKPVTEPAAEPAPTIMPHKSKSKSKPKAKSKQVIEPEDAASFILIVKPKSKPKVTKPARAAVTVHAATPTPSAAVKVAAKAKPLVKVTAKTIPHMKAAGKPKPILAKASASDLSEPNNASLPAREDYEEEKLRQDLERLNLNRDLNLPPPLPGILIPPPLAAKSCLQQIHEAGRWAFIVGGYPRDSYLRTTDESAEYAWWDIDIIARGKREEILGILQNGTRNPYNPDLIHLNVDGIDIDIVCTEKSIKDVLLERDLTINSLLCTIEGEVLDPMNVIHDFKLPYLKCLPSTESSQHIAAIVLRLIRFSTTLKKFLLPETVFMMQQYAPKIQELPFGLYLSHIDRLFLRGKAVEQLYALRTLQIYQHLFPDTLPCNTIHYDYRISEFILEKFKIIDALSVERRKTEFSIYHIMALLLLPNLMETATAQIPLEVCIETLLKAFCRISPEEPYNSSKAIFQKAMPAIIGQYFNECHQRLTPVVPVPYYPPVMVFYYPVAFVPQPFFPTNISAAAAPPATLPIMLDTVESLQAAPGALSSRNRG